MLIDGEELRELFISDTTNVLMMKDWDTKIGLQKFKCLNDPIIETIRSERFPQNKPLKKVAVLTILHCDHNIQINISSPT